MFIIRFLRWLMGWVRFEAVGGFPERLLNLAARNEISIWASVKSGVTLTGCCRASQYHRLRPYVRKAGMRMHITEKHGVPFFVHRYRARAGIVVGVFVYAAILLFLSRFIWVIQVSGNETVSSEKIAAAVEDLGVKRGGQIQQLDIQSIRMLALQRLPELSWLTVNPEGSVAHIVVTERKEKEKAIDSSGFANIVAARDGIILSTEVYEGQSCVHAGDAAGEGMMLVSGVVDTQTGPVLKRARAKIMAETHRTFQVSVPFKETKLLPSGEVIFRPTFYLFGFSVPFYTNGTVPVPHELVKKDHPLTANQRELPFGFTNLYYELLQQTELVYTKDKALTLAENRLATTFGDKLSQSHIISKKQTISQTDDSLTVRVNLVCHEDIAKTQMLLEP